MSDSLGSLEFQCNGDGPTTLTLSIVLLTDATVGYPQDLVFATPQNGTITCDDGDGIASNIDTQPTVFSENFSDVHLGGLTYGTIFHTPGMTLTVTDESFPGGVRIVASGTGGPAPIVAFCNPKFRAFLTPGDDIVVTCSSADVEVDGGTVVTWFGTLIASLSSGADVRVTEPSPGSYNITNNSGNTVVVGGITLGPGGSTTGENDTDQDGLADSAETALGSNPNSSDSDGDGLSDGLELAFYGTSPLLTDSDGDGCAETRELGNNEFAGGKRNPAYYYDYADMPILGATPVRDSKVRVNDILAVVQRYFSNDADGTAPINRNSDPLSTPPATGYHPAFDRGGQAGANVWNAAPPDGHILVPDILHVVYQYFHDCA